MNDKESPISGPPSIHELCSILKHPLHKEEVELIQKLSPREAKGKSPQIKGLAYEEAAEAIGGFGK